MQKTEWNFFKCSWEIICVKMGKIGELQCGILLMEMLEVNSGFAHGSTVHVLLYEDNVIFLTRTQIIYSTCRIKSTALNISVFPLSEQLYSIHREKK